MENNKSEYIKEKCYMDTLMSLFALARARIAGFFYFRKKDTNKRNISIAVSVISFFLLGMFFGYTDDTKEEDSSNQDEVVKIEKDEENEDETENIKEEVKSEPVTVDGAEKEIKEIEATVKERVSDEYTQASILDLRINEHLGTEDNDDDYIVLAYLKWDRRNKAETTRGMLEKYSDDLAATLAKHQNIEEITVFWEVPYHLEGSNSVKTNYLRSGERMAIEDRWFDPVLR